MKQPFVTLCLALGLAVLAGCTAPEPAPVSPTPTVEVSPTPAVLQTCRIVDGAETGKLILAGDGGRGDVYLLDFDNPFTGPGALEDGMLIQVGHDGMILETYPAQFANVLSFQVLDEPKDDLCGLYLQVLADLWAVDSGLNEGIDKLGVDLSGLEGLTDSEKSALGYAFGMEHGLMPIEGTWEELRDQGYYTEVKLEGDPSPEQTLWQWEDGCLFSIEGNTASFTAEKWCAPLGAYVFYQCTAEEAAGVWSYSVGAEMIS